MLSYHPAYDPHHTALRMLQIFLYDDTKKYYKHEVRIIDFYILFPELIDEITTTRPLMHLKKQVAPDDNEYFTPGRPKTVFRQMEEIQDTALSILLTTDMVEKKDKKYSAIKDNTPPALVGLVSHKNKGEAKVMHLLTTLQQEVPSIGEGSLKDRSGLVEYRYDAV